MCGLLNFFLVLKFIEIPQLYNNSNSKEVPSFNRPRTLYFPLFQLSYINDIPPLWTMIYPLESQRYFNDD